MRINIGNELDLKERLDGSSHVVDDITYCSESGNCHGVCKKCGEELHFYVGSYSNSKLINIVNPGSYLLNTCDSYKKVNVDYCSEKNVITFRALIYNSLEKGVKQEKSTKEIYMDISGTWEEIQEIINIINIKKRPVLKANVLLENIL